MKKILSTIGMLSLIAIPATTLLSCTNKPNEINENQQIEKLKITPKLHITKETFLKAYNQYNSSKSVESKVESLSKLFEGVSIKNIEFFTVKMNEENFLLTTNKGFLFINGRVISSENYSEKIVKNSKYIIKVNPSIDILPVNLTNENIVNYLSVYGENHVIDAKYDFLVYNPKNESGEINVRIIVSQIFRDGELKHDFEIFNKLITGFRTINQTPPLITNEKEEDVKNIIPDIPKIIIEKKTSKYNIKVTPSLDLLPSELTNENIEKYLEINPSDEDGNSKYFFTVYNAKNISGEISLRVSVSNYIEDDVIFKDTKKVIFNKLITGFKKELPPILEGELTKVIVNKNFSFGGIWWNKTNLEIIDLEGYTSIENEAFAVNENINSIAIPSTITKIGNKAFYNSSLSSIVIPESVTWIGVSAFESCPNILEIKLPDNLTTIRDRLFYGCYSLEKISLPNKLMRMGNNAFEYSEKLKTIILPNDLSRIGFNVFNESGLTSIQANKKLKSHANHFGLNDDQWELINWVE